MIEKSVGETDEWYTPDCIFEGLKMQFDLDPCSPGAEHQFNVVPAKYFIKKEVDGLKISWFGIVFMNPPFGKRNSHTVWLDKFIEHGQGIALVRAYTSSGWFHKYIRKFDAMLFPKGKTKFIMSNGDVGKQPGHGIVLLALGKESVEALRNSNLGLFVNLT